MASMNNYNLPQHIAIIMDGNGRWARKHAIGRIRGHEKGAKAVRTVVKACREMGIKYLTLFAFSVENWERPPEEVEALMNLLEDYLAKELPELQKQEIRLISIGDIERLRPSVKEKLDYVQKSTSQNDKMVLNLALSYGGKDEIVVAAKRIAKDYKAGRMDIETLDKETFSRYLYTAGLPDPDLLIRTSGECRISNFLLWQMAYTELYFTEVLWPDFTKKHLLEAIADYQQRERRFGLTSDQIRNSSRKMF